MGGLLLDWIILVIVVCIVAGIILWCVSRFFPDIFPPARLIVGGVALIIILIGLKPILSAVL